MNLRILATKNSWCVHISWRNSWNKYFYFCRCWLFLNKWNNEILVTNIAPPNNFNSSHRGLSPNVIKTSASTKFWQISKLSPPPPPPPFPSIIMDLFFSIFDIIPRWRFLAQKNGNMNFWNMLNMHIHVYVYTEFVESQQ